mgnify:CR=1 FL=1
MFTPTTPYVHKFRTELCKTYEAYGKCKYGDEVSTNLNLFNLFNILTTKLKFGWNLVSNF